MITVTVCVGSSCHVKGAREMIAGFNKFLTEEGLEDKVELKGSFCMERCGEGINWKINDQVVSSTSVEEGMETLRQQISELLGQEQPEEPDTRST